MLLPGVGPSGVLSDVMPTPLFLGVVSDGVDASEMGESHTAVLARFEEDAEALAAMLSEVASRCAATAIAPSKEVPINEKEEVVQEWRVLELEAKCELALAVDCGVCSRGAGVGSSKRREGVGMKERELKVQR